MILLIVFWSCVAVSIALSVCGILARSPRLLFIAAAFVLPLAYYLFGSPTYWPAGLALPVSLVASGLLVRRRRPWAIALAAVVPAVLVWMEMLVILSQQRAAA